MCASQSGSLPWAYPVGPWWRWHSVAPRPDPFSQKSHLRSQPGPELQRGRHRGHTSGSSHASSSRDLRIASWPQAVRQPGTALREVHSIAGLYGQPWDEVNRHRRSGCFCAINGTMGRQPVPCPPLQSQRPGSNAMNSSEYTFAHPPRGGYDRTLPLRGGRGQSMECAGPASVDDRRIRGGAHER